MKVSEALSSRFSCRAFLETAVPEETLRDILERATKAPSGGNLQPWHVHVLTGPALTALVEDVRSQLPQLPLGEGTEYDIYPPGLKEPYRSRRFKCGQDLYGSVGIPREDREARLRQFQRNYAFFGAPAGLLFCLDRSLGPPQWSDLGMYILSVMLLAREHGLHSCPQEAWAAWPKTVARHISMPEEQMLFCGLAVGYADEEHPVNKFHTERAGLADFATFYGEIPRS